VRAAPHVASGSKAGNRLAQIAAHFQSRYFVATPRGEIEAGKVVYATNGFTGHLLPTLRGRLYPLRGTMSVQDLGSRFPNRGNELSWQFYREKLIESETADLPGALYYLTQNVKTGHMFLGGEMEKLETILSPDDSMLNGQSATELTKVLPDVFENAPTPGLKSIWSGIMGFTVDGMPLIGRLPEVVTGRPESGEFICAGFNGYGTGYCFMCGQAVAQMIIGKDVSSWVPDVFFLTKERFEKSLDTENWWPGLLEL
jgi:glycine/D-amino acid oxidase-like deaminating enzyme